eukprot:scaffold1107_cov185-Pinguiococcus_pyrenoidosus.AAC.4
MRARGLPGRKGSRLTLRQPSSRRGASNRSRDCKKVVCSDICPRLEEFSGMDVCRSPDSCA